LEALWNIFKQMGIKYELGEDFVTVWGRGEYDATDVTTHEYPGFATDIQSPLIVLLTQCNGSSIARETIFEGRLFFTDKLNQMGANIILCDPFRAVIYGKTPLFGRRIESPDLRAGMALLLAGLIAKGTTEVQNIGQIDRGYEAIEKRLQAIGAKIERVKE
jgi:UDP-N-acetylglucosamine 1-carboxyvinyltransferase